jgi:hypothetical protein
MEAAQLSAANNGTLSDALPLEGWTENFSPTSRIATAALGKEIAGGSTPSPLNLSETWPFLLV